MNSLNWLIAILIQSVRVQVQRQAKYWTIINWYFLVNFLFNSIEIIESMLKSISDQFGLKVSTRHSLENQRVIE